MIATPPGAKVFGRPRRFAGRLVGGAATDWAYAAGWMAVRAAPEFVARIAFDTAMAGRISCAKTWHVSSVYRRPTCRTS